MSGVVKDLQHAFRALASKPGFTIVAVLTLALGVGATTAMFSAVDAILLESLPYRDPEDIVVLRQLDRRDGSLAEGLSAANVQDVARLGETLSATAFAEAHGLRLRRDGRAISLRGWLVSAGFFEAVGGRAVLGRTFLPEEYAPGGAPVVMLGHRSWQARFDRDPDIVGRSLVLDGVSTTVVGVLPPSFRFPADAEVWGPRPPQPWDEGTRGRAHLETVARLAPGTTRDQAQVELDRLAAELAARHPQANRHLGLQLTPLRTYVLGAVETPLLLLFGAVSMVLFIAAANIAGLQLARGTGRAREYALRRALGASSGRLARLFAVESGVLAVIGGGLGAGLAALGIRALRSLGPDHLPRFDQLEIDGKALLFALSAAALSAIVAGVAPALWASRVDLRGDLAEGGRGGGRRGGRLRDRLVVAEIAVALVLTLGAGLLLRSFDRLFDSDLGFEPEGRLAVQVWAYDDDHRPTLDFFARATRAVRAIPGVAGVGLTTDLPLADDRSVLSRSRVTRFQVGDRASAAGEERTAGLAMIDEGYAQTIGIDLVAGRHFRGLDRPSSVPVAMVNEVFARRFLAGRSALGERLVLNDDEASREIVGVLADVRRQGFESEPRPEIYLPLAQRPSNGLTFVIATDADPASLTKAVQEALWRTDPNQATWAIRPLSDLLGDWVRQRRFDTVLLTGFASLALALAGIGVYALMSFSVSQRIHELGIRRALGGRTHDLLMSELRRGLTLAVLGIGLGLLAALGLTHLLRSMLFGTSPLDPLTFALISLFVLATTVLAALLPARRAAKVDPMVALRAE